MEHRQCRWVSEAIMIPAADEEDSPLQHEHNTKKDKP